MKRLFTLLVILIIAAMVVSVPFAQFTDTGVRVEAQNTVNLRAYPGTDTDLLGQMSIGVQYIALGRHELFPWVLVGDPVTLEAIGWVFRDIVTITGNINQVPFFDEVVSSNPPTATRVQEQTTTSNTTVVATSTQAAQAVFTSTPTFSVSGTAYNEINIRYGPGIDYQRVGVAQAGDRFQIVGYHTQFPWVQIRYEDSPTDLAWIATSVLDIEGDIFSTTAISNTTFNQPTLTPTPAVIQAANGLSDAGTTVSPELAALGNQIFSLALNLGFDPATSQFGSLYLMDLQTGEAITYGNNIAYSGTSVSKISILATLYGTLDAPPRELLATDIANTMICSENTATNRLIAVIGNGDEWAGAAQVTEFLRILGLDDSYILSPFVIDPENPPLPAAPIPVPETSVDQAIAFPEPYNQMTVTDMGLLLSAIYQCAYEESGPLIDLFETGTYEPRECRQMIHVMANNTVDALLVTGAPAEARVAHKHGWINDTHTNAGIFFTDGGDYVVTMALHSNLPGAGVDRWLEFSTSLPVFSETSRQIYNYFNPTAPQLENREGFIPETASCNFAGSTLVGDLMQSVWDE
ncbi:MAG: serine hydrolase [Phototrophicaceae bacterium]